MSSTNFTSDDRAYLTALPTDRLVERLRQHADAEIYNTLRYIVSADNLMLVAADRISMLERELAIHRTSKFAERDVMHMQS